MRYTITQTAALIICLMMALFAFAGCGGSKSGTSEQSTKAETTAAEQTSRATDEQMSRATDEQTESAEELPDRNGVYDSKDEVALYLYVYKELPRNYITKKEARKLGWEGGSVEEYLPGACIGGDHFGNYEKKLPKGDYRECDIDTLGWKNRGSRRLIYSDTDIYYTGDHYKSFEHLYDKDGKL